MIHRAIAFTFAAMVCLAVPAAALSFRWRPDAPAHLYIAEQTTPGGGVGQVAVFPLSARGNVAPEYVIAGPHTGILYPESVNFDARGNVYVYDDGGYPRCNRVLEFAHGSLGDAKPLRVIEGNATQFCGAGAFNIAVTPAGDVYVPLAGESKVLIFLQHQHGNATPAKILTYVANPVSLEFDANGNLWSSQNQYLRAIDEFSPGGKHLAEIQNPGQVFLFAVDRGLLYAPAEKRNIMVVTDIRTLQTKYSFAYSRRIFWSVSIDRAGIMYFFYTQPRHKNEPPIIDIYPPGGSVPTGSLGGPLTGLNTGGSARVGP